MFRKPNYKIDEKANSSNAKNQIIRRFPEVFRVLLDPGYYEGTEYAQYFNGLKDNGQSSIYVTDPYEKDLERFVNDESSRMTFLVGLTGMGKTTLIRNFFRINNRDIKIIKNTYILYISFYYSNLSMDMPYKSVEYEVERYLSRLCGELIKRNPGLIRNSEDFFLGLYEFIYGNKPMLLSNSTFTPEEFLKTSGLDERQKKLNTLNELHQSSAIEYYSSLIKYIFSRIGQSYKLVIIFDDIEAKHAVFHHCAIEIARHLYSCMCATTDVEGTIKCLVSLRAYTFRCNIERIAEARREFIERDVILKKTTVTLKDIFETRFKAIETEQLRIKPVGNPETYCDAKRELYYVYDQLNQIGGELIFFLSNYNLTDAMVTFSRIMTNVIWVTGNERENNGAFRLDSRNYNLTKYNLIRAIAMGNNSYYDATSECVPNIVQFNGQGTELLCFYIIRYLINNKYYEIYGTNYVEGKYLLDDLTSLFCPVGLPQNNREQWEDKFYEAIDYLYYEGVLFRSLYDIEDSDSSQIQRKYSNDYKLYLSPRGKKLYELFGDNVVMMELLRDDIETDLEQNDKLTIKMKPFDKFHYLIGYLRYHFRIERINISQALFDLERYRRNIGDELITAYLLRGLSRNVRAYFGSKSDDYYKISSEITSLYNEITEYTSELNNRFGCRFRNIPIMLPTD